MVIGPFVFLVGLGPVQPMNNDVTFPSIAYICMKRLDCCTEKGSPVGRKATMDVYPKADRPAFLFLSPVLPKR